MVVLLESTTDNHSLSTILSLATGFINNCLSNEMWISTAAPNRLRSFLEQRNAMPTAHAETLGVTSWMG